MAKVSKVSTIQFRKRTPKKLGRHRKYRGRDYKAYKGQGK